MIHQLIDPFLEFAFMRRALVGCLALSLGGPPIGVFLVLRRMSLMGDAMSHAILPGAAIGFLISGLSLFAMSLGGFIAGITIAVLAGVVSRSTVLREDASLAAFYLVSLALGVLIVSIRGSSIDLLHVLFGTVLALDDAALILIAAIATLSMTMLAIIYRPLIVECFDPQFLRSVSAASSPTHLLFLGLVVLNLIGGFQALGTLMAVGIMLLGARRFGADSGRSGLGFWREPNRAACLLLREPAFRSRHHSHQRRGLSLVVAAWIERRRRLAARAAPTSRSVTCRQRRSS